MEEKNSRNKIAILPLVFSILIAGVTSSCMGTNDGNSSPSSSSTSYTITVSTQAAQSDLNNLQSSLQNITQNSVTISQFSAMGYIVAFSGSISNDMISSINQTMTNSSIVCEFCQDGTGCLDEIMNKPGCL